MKKIASIVLSLLASVAIVLFVPGLLNKFGGVELTDDTTDAGMFSQSVVSVNAEPSAIHKVYSNGVLVGILTDESRLDEQLENIYAERYEETYPGSELKLGKNVYISDEQSYFTYEDADDEILAYIDDNALYCLKAVKIVISEAGETTAEMYALNEEMYEAALNTYISFFIDPDTLKLLENGQTIGDLTTYGRQDIGISIAQEITIGSGYAAPEEIKTTESEILEYLEYGEATEKQYYTVKEYDTVAGIGAKNYGLSATQVMNINRDKISSVDQVLSAGEELCVSYFNSPLDITVYKQALRSESVEYETVYIEDDTMLEGESEVTQEGKAGSRNAMYSEKWVNGVLISGALESSVDVEAPVERVVAVGTKLQPGVGTGVFTYPVKNPAVSCAWGCYYGHMATDFINKYDSWGDVYAADSGVIEVNSYNYVNGNYVIINHNNGMTSYYGHMLTPSWFNVGDVVEKGEAIGHIGMTGYATGPHTHFFITVNGERRDACTYFLDCDSLD